jgi:tRNA-guanine family transglycosylase
MNTDARQQRFGNAVTGAGVINLRNAQFATDFGPVEDGCKCTTCKSREEGGLGVTRSYMHHMVAKETVGAHLLTVHNVFYQLNLMRQVREAILEDTYPDFVKTFFANRHPKGDVPDWAREALKSVGVEIGYESGKEVIESHID